MRPFPSNRGPLPYLSWKRVVLDRYDIIPGVNLTAYEVTHVAAPFFFYKVSETQYLIPPFNEGRISGGRRPKYFFEIGRIRR